MGEQVYRCKAENSEGSVEQKGTTQGKTRGKKQGKTMINKRKQQGGNNKEHKETTREKGWKHQRAIQQSTLQPKELSGRKNNSWAQRLKK